PGQCLNPVAIVGVLPGQSPSVWGAGASTCDVLNTSWFLSDNPDFTFRLLAAPGASYLIVVSGYGDSYRCGSAALAVTASFPETSESSVEESSEASAAATTRKSRKLLHGA
ncbi:hypothetical protein HaLaN_04114, partial [Haematococcus lacustris]